MRQLADSRVLTEDPFTITAAGEPWRTQSWLLELGYGWLEQFSPLVSGPILIGVSAVILLLSVGLRVAKGRGLIGPLGTIWVMWLTLGYFTARPVFMSLALFGLVLLAADDRRLRWVLPLLFWVWASVHGGFFMGLGYLVLKSLAHKDRRFLVDAVAGAIAVTFTAHGLGVWEILLNFATSRDNLDLIAEWLPPDFVSIAHLPFLLALIGLIWMGAAGRLVTRDLWVLLPFVAFAFTANRSVPLAAIAIAPLVFRENAIEIGKRQFPLPVALGAVVVIFLLPFLVPVDRDTFEKRFPVAAYDHLEEVPTFHDDAVGGYLIYRRFGYVFIDDRAELLGEAYQDFVNARSAKPGWREVFEEYGFEQAIVRPKDPIRAVLELSGWSIAYADDDFVVLRMTTN